MAQYFAMVGANTKSINLMGPMNLI